MRFSYYDSLSRKSRATYRKSDGLVTVPLETSLSFTGRCSAIQQALLVVDGRAVQISSQKLVSELCQALEIRSPHVKVLSRRPRDANTELHGLYEWEEGCRPEVRVWMRTAQRKNVVAYKSFLRTLLHELCHHLDFALFGLEESFHTEGFFKREAWLFRRVTGTRTKRSRSKRTVKQNRQQSLPFA